jgi:DNA-binding transcriptional LysR family regulator
MELRHIRYFVAVAEEENVTRAARRLHVSQPALSRQIRDLEEELGCSLLERGAKAVRLTDAGRAFLEEARAVLQRTAEAVQRARAVARGETGEIHVGYAPSPTVELLPRALHAFQNMAPGVGVELHDLSTEEMLGGLGNGKLHVCLMVRPAAKAMRGLEFELLREYPVCVGAPLSHPFARQRRVKLLQLAGQPLLAFAQGEYPEYHQMLSDLLGASGVAPRIVEQHLSGSSLIAAVEAGRGLAILPACMAMLVGGRLMLRPLTPEPSPLQVGAVYMATGLSQAAQKFLAAARIPLKRKAQAGSDYLSLR